MVLLESFLGALTPLNLLLALVGVVLGTVIGALPGLSATMAVAVLVPFTFTMDPASGLIALGAIYTGAIYGGAYAAILVNTPGTPSSIATTFDGYPMAKRGDGGLAVTLATLSSVVGGLVGGLFLLFLSPPLARVALAFGPPEYFWLAIFGLTLISALSVGNTVKGLIGACLGLLMSMVGVAVVGGDIRYTLDTQVLLGGIDITSALIGLYCVPVVIDLVATRAQHLTVEDDLKGIRLGEALSISWARKFNVIRSSVIGTVIGILPGAGGSIAGLVSYSEARRASRHPERFGKGEPDGVIATEAANNATVGGGFIPTLVLGIPGTPPDAIILGALLVQGIKIGPTLFSAQGNIVYTFIFGLLIATVLMLPAGLLIGKYAYRSIISIPKPVLVPTVAFLTIIGSFAIHSNIHDTQMMFVLGILAWILNRFGFAPSPIVLGLVLGQIAEQGFVQSYLIGNAQKAVLGMFFGRPISLAIIVAAAFTLLYPLVSTYLAKRRSRAAVPLDAVEDAAPEAGRYRDPASLVMAALFIVLGVFAYLETAGMTAMGSVFPTTISAALIVLSLVLVAMHLRRPGRPSPVAGAALAPAREAVGWRRIAAALAMAVWILAIPVTGFATAGLLGFILMIAAASWDRPQAQTLLGYAIATLVLVAGFYLLMAKVLLLRMPPGALF
ncbi:tripartite tricarboxylate transporter permease [Mangrovibrevibacter kandeliae]|uniref:tripartite tricarboxylate transporter permease n=1 Tax=Mangrovibrevibacter kandeliae TaxID=2968473 RepID=UPI0021190F6F|nr:tripartite tricarboxylate transporter permease [Aurantimonas sp. CSK15Z-1]MCQ8781202.1 tripartite tricarboxylate transporter permease [Aurantimonas sp. CSK15Z-1]